MSSELYEKVLLMYGVVLFIAFIFYTLISKFMLKVNDLFCMPNKKSEISILAAPLFIFFLFVLFTICNILNLKIPFMGYTISGLSFLLSLVMANIVYLIISITRTTGKELKMLGFKNEKFYEDIYCYKLTLLYVVALVVAASLKNQILMNYFMVCMYPLLYGYYKTYNFLGNSKISYTDTFIANNIHKELKNQK